LHRPATIRCSAVCVERRRGLLAERGLKPAFKSLPDYDLLIGDPAPIFEPRFVT